MQHSGRYTGGERQLSQRRLNSEDTERRRLGRVRGGPGVRVRRDSTGIHLDAQAQPFAASIQVTNAAGTQIPAFGYIQLLTYDGDADTWTGMVPAYPGLVLVAICGEDPIDPQGSGTAYAPWANPGLVKVLTDPTYGGEPAPTDANAWLVCKGGSATAQPTRGLTALKVVSLLPPPPNNPDGSTPPPPDPTAPITVYAAFSGGWLG